MRSCLVVLGLVACSSPARAPSSPPAPVSAPVAVAPLPAPGLRLPRAFLPSSYSATLAIDPARSDFDGRIAIAGAIAAPTSAIWLHGRRLTIRRAVARQDQREVALTVEPHGDDVLAFRSAAPLTPGPWTVAIDYAGRYEELATAGAFKQVVDGAPYVFSQLEAIYGRRVFPCVDEPDLKVPWQLTLEVPASAVALSNTRVERDEPIAGTQQRRVRFARTRPLPSYLVAFAVGPFEIVDAGTSSGGAPIRMVTMKGRSRDVAWAAKTTPRLLALLEDFFGSPYPYDKLDMVTIPLTVGFGAMENAGMITFSESTMLIEPEQPSRGREYSWIYVATHELAHQWFGDLVTMRWWDDIWLNEGFANWAERKISAQFEPSWREALAEEERRGGALDFDALVTARQIRQPIHNPDDILGAFDGITYDKGASVLNMFEGYLGSDVFVRGVRHYLAQHADGNATSADFAAAIGQTAGKDIAPALATFLEQPGAPELAPRLICERGQPPKLALRQQRYVPPGASTPTAGKPWSVPVCVAYDRGGKRGEACALLDATEGAIVLEATTCPRWVMPNAGGRGYYRVAYDATQASALRDIAWAQLQPAERQAVVFDVNAGALTGALPLSLALSLAPRLLASGDRFSMDAALKVPFGARVAVPAELEERYEAWLRTSFGPAARKAGLAPSVGDSLDVETSRRALIEAAGEIGRDPALIDEAIKLVPSWRGLSSAIRYQVIAMASQARPAIFEQLLRDVHDEPDRRRRGEILAALGSTRAPAQQRAALALVLDPKLDIRETAVVLFSAATEANRVVAQQFFREHKDAILARIPQDGTAQGPASLAWIFTTSCVAERRAEIADYVTATFAKLPGGERTVTQALESMDQCIARRAKLEPAVRAWLSTRGGSLTRAAR